MTTDEIAKTILDGDWTIICEAIDTPDKVADLQAMAKLWLEVSPEIDKLGRCSVCKQLDISETWCGDPRQGAQEHKWQPLALEEK